MKPVYVSPADAFDNANSEFQGIRPTVDGLLSDVQNSEKWHEPWAENPSIIVLVRLAKDGHVPSKDLLARMLIAESDAYWATGGGSGKFKKQWDAQLRQKKTTRKAFEKDLAASRILGINLLNDCARYGYSPAADKLREIGETVPQKDLQTEAEERAVDEYNAELQSYEVSKKRGAEIVAGILGVALVAGAAVLAAENAKHGGGTPTFLDDDLQGCCSWHNGIKRDLFGNPQCFFNRLICNDNTYSPTCSCPN